MTAIKTKKGYTLVEILIASAVSVVFLGMAISLFMQFTKSFSSGESSVILMQNCALFTARLRNDMNNAVKAKNGEAFMVLDEKQLLFNIYDSSDGSIKPVVYTAVPQSNGYFDITRRIGNKESSNIVKGKIASYAWALKEEIIPTKASPIKRFGLELNLKMGSNDLKNKSFDFKTVIYPVRVNRSL